MSQTDIKKEIDAVLEACPSIIVHTSNGEEWDICIPEVPACRYAAFSPQDLLVYVRDAQAVWERHQKNKETLERVNRKARRTPMKKVVVFASCRSEYRKAYSEVEEQANEWLVEHPEATLLTSHANQSATEVWTEFALTLIVELPEEEEKPEEHHMGSTEKEVLDAIKRNDPACISEIVQATGFAENDVLASIAKLVGSGKATRFSERMFRPVYGEEEHA